MNQLPSDRHYAGTAKGAILLLAKGDPQGRWLAETPRLRIHQQSLERLCAEHGHPLRTIPLRPPHYLVDMGALAACEPVSGVMIWGTRLSAHLKGILETLRPWAKPVAVLDEIGDLRMPLEGGPFPHLRFFSIAARAAGRAWADRLLALGHRQVAYISPCHEDTWSRLRLQGLEERFREAGPDAAVLACVDPAGRGEWLDMLARVGRDGAESPRDLLQDLGVDLDEETRSAVVLELQRINDREQWLIQLAPLARRALRNPGVTAWVAANDAIGTGLLSLLKVEGMDVPRRMSVAGFDGTPEAARAGLASYDFRLDRLATVMFHYLRHPGVELGQQEVQTHEVPGDVVDGPTLGPPRPS